MYYILLLNLSLLHSSDTNGLCSVVEIVLLQVWSVGLRNYYVLSELVSRFVEDGPLLDLLADDGLHGEEEEDAANSLHG